MQADLARYLPGVDWGFSQYIRDNVMEVLSGVKGDNSVKIVGPDIDKLEEIAEKVAARMQTVNGVEDVGIFHITGQPNLEFAVDRANASAGACRSETSRPRFRRRSAARPFPA